VCVCVCVCLCVCVCVCVWRGEAATTGLVKLSVASGQDTLDFRFTLDYFVRFVVKLIPGGKMEFTSDKISVSIKIHC
jgi:hypothetical protein